MITLQTPGTGFDDFESRIALGLCRVALDCVDPTHVTLEEIDDRYVVHLNSNDTKRVGDALSLWILRSISSEDFLQKIPGTRPKEIYDGITKYKKTGKSVKRKGHASKMADFGLQIRKDPLRLLDLYRENFSRELRRGAHDNICGHTIDKILGAILAFSPQLGSPPIRNNPVRSTEPPDVCPYCASLGLLGIASFQVGVTVSRNRRLTKERYFFMPRFRGKTTGSILQSYITAAKHIQPRLNNVPTNSALLALLSYYPHIGRIVQEHIAETSRLPTFFVARADTSGNAPRYQHFEERNIDAELLFLGDNPYNVALAQSAYRYTEDKPELLGLLSKTLQFKRNQDAVSFCREYVSTTKGRQLLYKESVKYIAKEVLNMDEKLIDNSNIGAVASMLKYFVRERRFGYVDNLRSSRSPDEFEKHLLSAQRDAASIYYGTEAGKPKPYMPNETNLRETLKALNSPDFDRIKTLICLLAFSF